MNYLSDYLDHPELLDGKDIILHLILNIMEAELIKMKKSDE